MLFEIVGKEENVIYHGEINKQEHYGNTPYHYNPKPAKKIVPTEFVDFGQGLLDLVEEIYQNLVNVD